MTKMGKECKYDKFFHEAISKNLKDLHKEYVSVEILRPNYRSFAEFSDDFRKIISTDFFFLQKASHVVLVRMDKLDEDN